ncbi:MAG: hypothetical protein UCJ13_02685, partial [Bacteroidaceae bacterium]|nr:hypothetical protein [Bacteroidaceae bacterium]
VLYNWGFYLFLNFRSGFFQTVLPLEKGELEGDGKDERQRRFSSGKPDGTKVPFPSGGYRGRFLLPPPRGRSGGG